MFLFTDGSRLSNSNAGAGAGWYGHWGAWKQESTRGHLCLPRHEVFDAEATAVYEGLKAACDSAQAPYTQNLYVLLDNQEVSSYRAPPEAPVSTPSWPSKKLQTPGPPGPHDARPFSLDKSMSTGSPVMLASQGMNWRMNKQRKVLDLSHRPTPLRQDMPGQAEL